MAQRRLGHVARLRLHARAALFEDARRSRVFQKHGRLCFTAAVHHIVLLAMDGTVDVPVLVIGARLVPWDAAFVERALHAVTFLVRNGEGGLGAGGLMAELVGGALLLGRVPGKARVTAHRRWQAPGVAE